MQGRECGRPVGWRWGRYLRWLSLEGVMSGWGRNKKVPPATPPIWGKERALAQQSPALPTAPPLTVHSAGTVTLADQILWARLQVFG